MEDEARMRVDLPPLLAIPPILRTLGLRAGFTEAVPEANLVGVSPSGDVLSNLYLFVPSGPSCAEKETQAKATLFEQGYMSGSAVPYRTALSKTRTVLCVVWSATG